MGCVASSAEAPMALEVTDRASLWARLHAAGADAGTVKKCLCSYSPPPRRLILSSAADFERLGVTRESVHGACDSSFWAYGDFTSVYESFALAEDDKERRVMGIEGVGSAAELLEAIQSGSAPLKIGHLSLLMLRSKVANGEWKWIDEAGCVMHTATPKPALLRVQLRSVLNLEVKVVRHEAFASGSESVGDLIIFDMDKADTAKETGNTKVFCQNPENYEIAEYETLSEPMKQAVDTMLAAQLK